MDEETLTSHPGDHPRRTRSPQEGPDLSGTSLGGYRLTRLIAEGGMGQVYEALQTSLNRKVALKILNDRLASRVEFLQRFEREARAAGALNHPNVVQVHDFIVAEGRHCLIMEYVEGEDLADYTERKGRLPVEEALPMVEQTALALKSACEKSIIHRDIKPSNLLLTKEGCVKVSDLGLAKILTDNADMTTTGAGFGSPHFLAPEQAEDARHADHRADIYSLGITLLFLLTGRRPYDGASSFSVVLAHANKPLPTGRELGAELPEPVEALIKRMAAKNPDDRHQDYDSLLTDLANVKAGIMPVVNTGLTWEAKRFWNLRPYAAACMAAVVLLLASIILWPVGKRSVPAPGASVAAKGVPEANRSASPPPPDDTFAGKGGPAGKEFRGPPGDEAGKARFQGGQRSSRLMRMPWTGPPPHPEFNAIPDGPVATMLAAADAYAAANKDQFLNIINRYRQVGEKAAGTSYAAEVRRKEDEWVQRHQAVIDTAIKAFETKMHEQLRAGSAQGAFDVWKDFPANLHCREADARIVELLEDWLPPDFQPK